MKPATRKPFVKVTIEKNDCFNNVCYSDIVKFEEDKQEILFYNKKEFNDYMKFINKTYYGMIINFQSL